MHGGPRTVVTTHADTQRSFGQSYTLGIKDAELRKMAATAMDTLRNCNRQGLRLVKYSSLGGDPTESFEQAFAQLAFTYIKDKAPRLLDHMAGFQLIDRNDDNTKSVGIFGFRLGHQWVYAPVFFLNGDLKGHELLYLKDKDLFVPLKENWVNHLMAKRPHILGEQTHETTRSLGVMQPDVRNLSIPPYYSKYSATRADVAVPANWPEWAVDFLPALGSLTTTSPNQKHASLDHQFTVPRLMKDSLVFCQMVKNACESYPEIGRLCRQYYGDDFLKEALVSLRDAVQTQQLQPPTYSQVSVLHGRVPVKQAAGPPVEIKNQDDVTITDNLGEEGREKLYRDGYLVRDYRSGDEVSEAYNVQSEAALSNPDASGFYDVLVRPTNFEELLILNEPQTSRGKQKFATVIRTDGKKNWINAHRTTLWTKPQTRNSDDQRKKYDSLGGVGKDSLKKDSTYVVVSPTAQGNLEGSAPFRVEDSFGDGRYRVHWLDSADRGRPTYLPAVQGGVGFYDGTPDSYLGDEHYHGTALIQFNDREGVRFKSLQGTLLVPAEAKVLTVEQEYTQVEDDDGPGPGWINREEWHSKNDPIDPGNWSDIQLEIMQKTAALKLDCDHTEACINNGPRVSRFAAFTELIRDYGFREKTAKNLLAAAERSHFDGRAAEFRVKYAQGYPMLGPGPTAPAIPEAQFGYDSTGSGYHTQQQQVDWQGVPELSSGMVDQNVYNSHPDAMPDPMAMQAAQQAGQMNQKEVFDASLIASLLKTVRKDSLVDRYTGDLMKALDRLGRILFMFYWHNDDFMQRYGKADMPELEDTVRNAFEILGDLLLFLTEKDVNPMPGADLEPDVAEAAGG